MLRNMREELTSREDMIVYEVYEVNNSSFVSIPEAGKGNINKKPTRHYINRTHPALPELA